MATLSKNVASVFAVTSYGASGITRWLHSRPYHSVPLAASHNWPLIINSVLSPNSDGERPPNVDPSRSATTVCRNLRSWPPTIVWAARPLVAVSGNRATSRAFACKLSLLIPTSLRKRMSWAAKTLRGANRGVDLAWRLIRPALTGTPTWQVHTHLPA